MNDSNKQTVLALVSGLIGVLQEKKLLDEGDLRKVLNPIPQSDSSPQSLMLEAVGFFKDAEDLAQRHGGITNTAAFLLGFVMELALKAYILHAKIGIPIDKKFKTHDLRMLWKWASTGPSSPFTMPLPQWLLTLNHGHDSPYWNRYRPADMNGRVVEPEWVKKIDTLLEAVKRSCSLG